MFALRSAGSCEVSEEVPAVSSCGVDFDIVDVEEVSEYRGMHRNRK